MMTKIKDLESQIIEDAVPEKKNMDTVNALLKSGFRNIYNDLTLTEKQCLWRSVIKEIRCRGNEIEEIVFL